VGNPKKYHLLYLPTGTLVEVLGQSRDGKATKPEWHKLTKSRQDLKKSLIRILDGKFSTGFYQHNEMLPYKQLKSCHFVFQKSVNTGE
jgi:hypothetical protein